jgi:protein-glutamine gamma-glutamyltransferase
MVKISRILQIMTYLVVLISYASVFQYIELYHSVCFLLLLALSIFLHNHRFVRIPRWSLNVISMTILLASSLAVSTEYLVEPVLGALIVLIAIKLLEEKTFRDYAQIFAMCIFLLLGSSLLSLSIAFLGYFSLIAFFSTTALILLAFFAQDSEIVIHKNTVTKVLMQSLLICAIALPSSLLFFIILPRTSYPILSFINRDGYARSGFTDSIRLGQISKIHEDNNVIFRVEMAQMDEKDLYWRGIVLDQFDGVSWKNGGGRSPLSAVSLEGREIHQVIYLEPYGNKYLFALDKPRSISLRQVEIADGLTYSAPEHMHERIRYEAASVVSEFLPAESIDGAPYLHIPPEFSPRIRRLAAGITRGTSGTEAIKELLHFIRQGNYRYSMEDLSTSGNPLEDFLFEHKTGNCEYFASSLAVMLRMAEIPARLVGGYRGGYYNRPAGYYMVLQSNAHVWVEAYLPEQAGWIRIDPTAFSLMDASIGRDAKFFLQMKLLFDTFNHYWFKLIINYDFSKQLALIKKIKATIQKPDIKIGLAGNEIRRSLPYLLVAPLIAFMICAVTKALRKRPEQRLITRFARKLGHYGYTRNPSEGLQEFIGRIDQKELRERAERFVNEFEAIYYKDARFSSGDFKSLNRSIREL